jgi:hypothetical protein
MSTSKNVPKRAGSLYHALLLVLALAAIVVLCCIRPVPDRPTVFAINDSEWIAKYGDGRDSQLAYSIRLLARAVKNQQGKIVELDERVKVIEDLNSDSSDN